MQITPSLLPLAATREESRKEARTERLEPLEASTVPRPEAEADRSPLPSYRAQDAGGDNDHKTLDYLALIKPVARLQHRSASDEASLGKALRAVVEVIDVYHSPANGVLPRLPASGQRAAAPTIGWGLVADVHEEHQAREQTTFEAQGTVTAADGSTVSLPASQEVRAPVETREVHVAPAEAPAVEPLVSSSASGAASIDGRQTFDLGAGGRNENIERAQRDDDGSIQHVDIVV